MLFFPTAILTVSTKRSVLHSTLLLLLPVYLMVASGCGVESAEGELSGAVQIDGSSTVYPITEAVAEEFMIAHRQARITVGVSGTGGGFSKFMRGETDINDASRSIKSSEMELAAREDIDFIELPVAYDGLVVVVHPDNDWAECLTVDELRAIWEPGSRINNWNEVRPGFPDRELALYGPGTDSGTYDYFTEAVGGASGASRSDFTASEDDNVLVQGVSGDPDALGFFGIAYYEENAERLKLLGIDDGDPENGEGCVAPSVATVENGTYAPLSRALFIYVRPGSAEQEIAREFVRFYLARAGGLVREVGYVPLTDEEYDLALERFERRVTGTMFGEEAHVGVTMRELLTRYMPAELSSGELDSEASDSLFSQPVSE